MTTPPEHRVAIADAGAAFVPPSARSHNSASPPVRGRGLKLEPLTMTYQMTDTERDALRAELETARAAFVRTRISQLRRMVDTAELVRMGTVSAKRRSKYVRFITACLREITRLREAQP